MKRGEVWTIAGAPDYGGKPRPTVIVQDETFATTDSITVCGFTSDPTPSDLLRIPIAPSGSNGLRLESSIMVDKITSVPRTKLGNRIGALQDDEMAALSRSIMVFLRLATDREL